MTSTPFDLILHQSYLHLFSYSLVIAILFVALADGYLVRRLRKVLRAENKQLREGHFAQSDLSRMVHPVARALGKAGRTVSGLSSSVLRRKVEMAEAALFIPLRTRISLVRDLSTLMGLIATLLALVAAATDFARHGKPELLIGSVGTGCVATCVAAVGCACALWNLSRLTRLRLEIACESEEVLEEMSQPEALARLDPMPLRQELPRQRASPSERNHAPL